MGSAPHLRRAAVLLPAALLLALLFAGPATGADPEKLVNANFRQQQDAQGVHYTPDASGRINSNYGWLYSAMNINNSGLSVQRRAMKPDGSEYVLEGRAGQLEVKRRFKVDTRTGGVRMVEIVRNPLPNPVSVRIILHAQLNYRYQSLVTNTGRQASGMLQKGEFGIVGVLQGTPGVVLYHLCGPTSRIKPTIVNQNQHQIQFHYMFQVPAGKTVSLVHGGVILRRGSPGSIKAAEALFKPYRSRKYRADLPKAVRRTLANVRGGPAGSDSAVPSIEHVMAVAPGTLDQLAFSDTTLLQGTATCRTLTVESPHGTVEVPFRRVAALVGARCATLDPCVHLRDGQKLTGRILAEGLRFEMTSGMAIDLDVAKLDRLVMRTHQAHLTAAGGEPARMGPDVTYLVETFEGTRLRMQKATEALGVATQWGEMQVALDELERLYLAGEDQPGYWVELSDGSRFRAFLRGAELEMESDLFGRVRLRPHGLRRIVAQRRKPRRLEEDDADEIVQPHVVLSGGDVFVGSIDLDAVHFLAPGGVVPQPPAQIRELRSELEGRQPEPGESLRFRAEVWGGGHITGELRELVVPVQTARGRLEVPVRDLVGVNVPTPVVPEVLRIRLRDLLADLGHPDYAKREAASNALAELGDLARSALEQALRETKDPEVRRRVRRVLDKL